MKTPKKKVLQFMYNQLGRYCALSRLDLCSWVHTKGSFEDGQYFLDEGFSETITLGSHWSTGYDEAHFFRTTVTVPEGMDDDIRLEFNIGGEALVKVNGVICGSVSTNRSAPERGTVLVPGVKAGDELHIELEAAVNSGEFCDKAMAGIKSTEYTFATAYLFVPDEACNGYFNDLNIAFQALEYIQDDYIRDSVYAAIDDSLHMVDFDFDENAVRASIAKAREFYAASIAAIPYSAQSEVILTGHSHIDVAWLWRIQESIRKSARTFSNVISLMDKYPEMTFGQSQAVLYDMIKKNYPELYERIKEKVANNQWDICGNVWVEADTNIASGEALIRQLLYGTEFFRKEFGKTSKTYWLPDCFGFSWALPQIIRRSGMENFITSKLTNNDTNVFPYSLFRWKGNNGDEILAYLQRSGYIGMFTVNELIASAAGNECKESVKTTMAMYGYGDGGGGPTVKMLESGRRLRNFPGLPKAKIDHVDGYFAEVGKQRESLPVFNGELYYENHRGTFTSQAFVKRNNRKGEYLFSRDEMLSVFAGNFCGAEYQKDKIEEGYKILLTNQFHDILPGSSIHEVFEDCRRDYAKMNQIGNEVQAEALAALNAGVHLSGDSVVVWNLASTCGAMPVSVEVPLADTVVLGSGGKQLPCSITEKDGKHILSFCPDFLNPMGFTAFRLAKRSHSLPSVKAEKTLLENSKLRITLDANGILTSVYDKVNAREALDGRGNILTVSLDKCVHETAWNLEINYQKKMWELTDAESITVLEANEQRGVLEIIRSFNKSTITQKLILNADSDMLLFDTQVDWHESDKVLKAGFDVAVINTDASYEIAHGAIKRPTHRSTSYDATRFEVAAHKWADLSEGGYGVSLLNDCKYGYDIKDSHMRITLMRAPTCPDRTGDHGISLFTYALYPHKNGWQDADTVAHGLEINIPTHAAFVATQNGIVPEGSLIEVDSANVIVEAVKQAQDGRGFILRLVETQQRRGKVRVGWKLGGSKVVECNLVEDDEAAVPFDGGFEFDIKPFEVRTFRIY